VLWSDRPARSDSGYSSLRELEVLRAQNQSLMEMLREAASGRELDRRSNYILELIAGHAPLRRTLTAIATLAISCRGVSGTALWVLEERGLLFHASAGWPGGDGDAPLGTPGSVPLDAGGEPSEAACAALEEQVRAAAAAGGVDARFVPLRDGQGGIAGLLVVFGAEATTWGNAAGAVLQLANLAARAIESHHLHERLAFHAQHDVLTGLPNRLLFHERVEAALSAAEGHDQKVAVLWIDLDRFKQINDTFGHKAGDEILLEVARRLRCSAHSSDTVARLGGDEFTVVISRAASEAVAETIAERIFKAISGPVTLSGHEVRISASIGISLSPEHGADAGMLMRHADLAMYQAKRSGRGQYQMFLPEFGHTLQRHHVIEAQLRGAVERNEFHLEYQPLTDPEGKIAGVEALLRWVNPELGAVTPSEFIPIAEESGLIGAIGSWVAHTACRDGASWLNAGCLLPNLSINVSALQLVDRDFAAMIGRVLRNSGFPATKLELEVTETALIRDPDRVLGQIAKLRAAGIRFSIDDFGNGYSSLNRLRTLPVDVLKIDQSFIHDIDQLGNNSLVEGIIALAHSLGLKVVAEGVENEAQLKVLRSMGCDRNQGFHLYRPMKAALVEKLLEAPALCVTAPSRPLVGSAVSV
jgi:diguanylate cyclase (GGDEF)-like protein